MQAVGVLTLTSAEAMALVMLARMRSVFIQAASFHDCSDWYDNRPR